MNSSSCTSCNGTQGLAGEASFATAGKRVRLRTSFYQTCGDASILAVKVIAIAPRLRPHVPLTVGYGRGAGVGRGRGVALGLGVGVGVVSGVIANPTTAC